MIEAGSPKSPLENEIFCKLKINNGKLAGAARFRMGRWIQVFDCVILAGGGSSDLTRQEGVPNKALIKIGRKEIIRIVINVYQQMKEDIDRLLVVGPEKEMSFIKKDYDVEILPESSSLIGNLLRAHSFLDSKNYLLISSSDTPLLSTAAVKDFMQLCRPFDKDFYYPIIRKEVSEKVFLGGKRTYLTLTEGAFTGGNLFLVNPYVIKSSAPLVEKFLKHRKNPLKMASLLGFKFLIGMLRKKLSVSQVEKRFSDLLKVKAKAVVSTYPEIGFDVDKPQDLELIRRHLSI